MVRAVPPIPDSLREELAYTLGDAAAEAWLEHAVERAHELIAAWDLVPHQVLVGGSESLCIKCDGPDGAPVVLKLPASESGGAAEIAALRAWGGRGAATVLREDASQTAVLMNFLGWVGKGSYGLDEVLELTDELHTADASGYPFVPVDENLARRVTWAVQRFAEPGHERHREDLALAEKLVVDLLFSDRPQVLLHGDLQAKNLIVSEAGLTAVDPLPVLGPALFDIAFWIAKSLHLEPTVRYVDRVAALRPELDAGELLSWTWALAVMENRPYLTNNAQRQEFVDGLRSQVTP